MRNAALIALRLFLAVLGGYLLSAGYVALGAVLLAGVMPRGEAFALSAMPGFVLYLFVLIWAFAQRKVGRLLVAIPSGALGGIILASINF